MAIAISCRSCGASASVPDSAAGKVGKCRKCGGSITVPAATTPAKVCTDCGVDVSNQKRTKDAAGRYFCQPCWQAKLDAAQAARLGVASRPVASAAKSTSGSSRSGAVAPPPMRSAPSTAPDAEMLEECPTCGMSVPANEMVLGDGDQMVCRSCAHQEISLADIPDEPVVNQDVPYAMPAAVQAAPVAKASRGTRAVPGYQPPPPRRYQAQRSSGAYDRALVVNGLIFGAGVAITVGTYLSAAGHGTYVVAWGAIIFGGIRFFAALHGKLSGG